MAFFFRSKKKNKIGKTTIRTTFYKPPSTFKAKGYKGKTFSKTKKKPSKLGKIFKKTTAFLIVICAIAFTSYLIFFSTFFTISNIKYQIDESELMESDLNPYITELLGKNIISVNPNIYEAQLKKEFPQIEKINIKKIFPKTIELYAKTFSIKANIINKYKDLEKKFLINEGGYLVSKDLENPALPYIVVFSEKEFELKTKLIKEDRFKKILTSIQLFQDFFNIKIFESIYYQNEREIHLKTEKGFYVKVDLQQSIEEQMDNLKNALSELNIGNTNLEYIDLRIPREVSYKTR